MVEVLLARVSGVSNSATIPCSNTITLLESRIVLILEYQLVCIDKIYFFFNLCILDFNTIFHYCFCF